MMDYMKEYKEQCAAFLGDESIVDIIPWGEGHINRTLLVKTNDKKYILQRINTSIFPSADDVMNNIFLVTNHLANKGIETMSVVPTVSGALYFEHETGCYRMYDFIENTITYQSAADEQTLYNVGEAFGSFQNQLADFDATKLCEIIKDFHNTPKRYNNFCVALDKNTSGRADTCRDEIKFVQDRANTYSKIVDGIEDGSVPVRTTHNDTKLNNILMDSETKTARAIIDLDTIMPGSMLYDYGDAIRFGASTAVEDEKDLSKVHFSLKAYTAYTKGFVKAVKNSITEAELELMPYSAYLMTIECGMRFLTDYLDGDVYFGTSYPEHNLVRCRTQFQLASEMEKQFDVMLEVCKKALSE